MKLTLVSPRTMLALALLVTAVASSTYAAVGAYNYYQFYPALTKMELTMTQFQWNSTSSVSLNASSTFRVVNPSSYAGFRLRIFQTKVDILLDNSTTVYQGTFEKHTTQALGPQGEAQVNVPFQGSGDGPRLVYQTIQQSGQVEFIFRIDVALSTFLDRVAGTVVSYQCQSSGGPANCEEIDIEISPSPEAFGQSGGGGGGGA